VLFRPGQQCGGFVVVHSGTVRVSLTGENGREIVLYRVRPGDICLQTFGCLVQGTSYGAEGVAETDLVIEMISPTAFQARVADDPAFRQSLFAAVAHRFADLERLVEDVALTGIPARLARALLRLADAGGTVTATQETLATEIGSAREVIGRQLTHFARGGLIASARGTIHVLAPDGLRALAGPSGVGTD
jgi:CRP/FNR family transcriptional regulator